MSNAVGYLRVSTSEQGRSGIGLAAQRSDIETFAKPEGIEVSSWYQDVQTGTGADALLLRPGLATALKEARAARCPLIVSRLDRLSRNVHFITGLMEQRVQFIVAAFESAERLLALCRQTYPRAMANWTSALRYLSREALSPPRVL
jgi:DNA invertase Pin-like site-specific DNA recombinase